MFAEQRAFFILPFTFRDLVPVSQLPHVSWRERVNTRHFTTTATFVFLT